MEPNQYRDHRILFVKDWNIVNLSTLKQGDKYILLSTRICLPELETIEKWEILRILWISFLWENVTLKHVSLTTGEEIMYIYTVGSNQSVIECS